MLATKEELEDWIVQVNATECLIIVEGEKDKKALQSLGVELKIVSLSKEPIFAVCEAVAKGGQEIIILTDFDAKGKELYGALKKNLEHLGVKINSTFREYLQKHTRISHVEGLDTYITRL